MAEQEPESQGSPGSLESANKSNKSVSGPVGGHEAIHQADDHHAPPAPAAVYNKCELRGLADLAKLADIDENELLKYKEEDFEDLTKVYGVGVKYRVRLREKHRQMIAKAYIPASRSFKSPMLMIRSAPVFIFFMPTFVAFFSAYSTNRLADVSWGQRAVEDGLDAGQQRIEKQAKCIAIIVPLLNIGYAVTISYVHLIAPQYVTVVAGIIMVVAGFTLTVSLISLRAALEALAA